MIKTLSLMALTASYVSVAVADPAHSHSTMFRSAFGACAMLLASATDSEAIQLCGAPAGGTVAIAAAVEKRPAWEDNKVMSAVACGPNRIAAETKALADCTAAKPGASCAIVRSTNRECAYAIRGYTTWKVGLGTGASAQEAYDQCAGQGLNCDLNSVSLGCVNTAPKDTPDGVKRSPPVARFVAAAYGFGTIENGTHVYSVTILGPSRALAEVYAKGYCESHRRSMGDPGTCAVSVSKSADECLVVALGGNSRGQTRTVTDETVSGALNRCRTDGFECSVDKVQKGGTCPP